MNPQENSILKNIHQANLVRIFDSKNNYRDEDDSWSYILVATVFALRSTYHNKLQATTVKLVFGYNMIINTPFIEDWEDISRRTQQLIAKNNQNKNKNYSPHIYRVHEKLLVYNNKKGNKYEDL